MLEYFSIYEAIIYLVLSASLILLLIFLNNIFSKTLQLQSVDKATPYECGFEVFSSGKTPVDVDFFLLLVFFLLFDIELLYVFPWIINIIHIKRTGHLTLLIFILVITLGFYYEYLKGALDWVDDILIL